MKKQYLIVFSILIFLLKSMGTSQRDYYGIPIKNPSIKKHVILTDLFILPELAPMKENKKTESAEKSAMEWTRLIMKESCLFPKKMKYVFIPAKSSSDFDLLRIRYQIGSEIIEITQTHGLFQVAVKLGKETIKNNSSKIDREKVVRELASHLFNHLEAIKSTEKKVLKKSFNGYIGFSRSFRNEKESAGAEWAWEGEWIRFVFTKSHFYLDYDGPSMFSQQRFVKKNWYAPQDTNSIPARKCK